jgi:integrase/recombinase XerD
LLDYTPHRRHRLGFLLAWGSGLRLSEVLNVDKHDFDFEKNQLLVRQGKGKKDRIVPIPKGMKKEFLNHYVLTSFVLL